MQIDTEDCFFLVKKVNDVSLSLVKLLIRFFCLLQNYNAKIADFGLAKLGPSMGESHVTTRIMGTYGYAAPEYVATGKLELTMLKQL